MRVFCCGLVSAPPERPGDDVCRLNASLRQPRGNTADLLDRPVDKVWGILADGSVVFLGARIFAWWRIVASMAKASITSET
jgi:hypothetical protein